MRPRDELRAALAARAAALEWSPPEIVIERPKDRAHGDWASPVALGLARPLQRPPREIAAALLKDLALDPAHFDPPSLAGPGFINVRLAPAYLQRVVGRILADPAGYARGTGLAGRRVNVEFVSSNPTGPLHVGHARNAVLGDAIAALLAHQGADVTREYYFNDAGRQMDILGASVHARYQQRWDPAFPFPAEGYEGEYIRDLAEQFTAEFGETRRGSEPADPPDHFRDFAGERISAGIRADLARFRVTFDVWFNESTLYQDGRLAATLDALRARDAIYDEAG
ncbi:MAG: arginine--tRNA ligase, partial [Gemmatimonadota bacterium]